MMTKEEVINKIIERYKSYKDKSFVNLVDCCGMDCENCHFKVTECADGVIKAIIERLIKTEGKGETNLEHFRETVVFDKANGIVHIHLINGWGKSYSDDKGVIDWLLEPCEEPKPKYKLSKFEYDLFDSCFNKAYGIKDSWALDQMHEKGYFKGIPNDISIKDILDNCEVIANETN